MKRRDFIKYCGGVALMPAALNAETMQAHNKPIEMPDNYFDFYSEITAVANDLSNTYFKPNYDESVEYDVIVIGSGIGGGILADATSDSGKKTLVIEAGQLRHFVHVANLPISKSPELANPYKMIDNSSYYGGVSFCLGGKSLFWSNVIPRMEEWELSYWPSAISQYLFSGGYDEAERLFRIRTQYSENQEKLKASIGNKFSDFTVSHLPRAFHTPTPSSRKGFPDELSTGFFSTAALITASMSSGGQAGNENLTINLGQIVTHIETKEDKAVAVHCYDPIEKKTRRFRGKNIVLSAGTMESARIALSSKLKDASNHIGIGPSFHQVAEMQFTIPDGFDLLSRFDQAKLYLRPKDKLKADRFTCELALNWQFWDAKTEDDDLWNQDHKNPNAAKSTIKFLFRHALDNRNFIRLNGSSCEIYLQPMDGEPFKHEITTLKNQLMAYFGASKDDIDNEVTYEQSSPAFWHIGGSLRMGGRGKGVVDDTLRFHEYKNLYACDVSVFPDIPAVNPSLTLGALALRLAKTLNA